MKIKPNQINKQKFIFFQVAIQQLKPLIDVEHRKSFK
jgi:hypothetical protein